MTVPMTVVTCAAEAAAVLRPAFPKRLLRRQECFVAVALDAQHRAIGRPWLVSQGTLTDVSVHPRDVFRTAVGRNAAAVLVGHSHPSGNCSPSEPDRALTLRLKECGALLGIPVLDHVIITTTGHCSLAERGWL